MCARGNVRAKCVRLRRAAEGRGRPGHAWVGAAPVGAPGAAPRSCRRDRDPQAPPAAAPRLGARGEAAEPPPRGWHRRHGGEQPDGGCVPLPPLRSGLC